MYDIIITLSINQRPDGFTGNYQQFQAGSHEYAAVGFVPIIS